MQERRQEKLDKINKTLDIYGVMLPQVMKVARDAELGGYKMSAKLLNQSVIRIQATTLLALEKEKARLELKLGKRP